MSSTNEGPPNNELPRPSTMRGFDFAAKTIGLGSDALSAEHSLRVGKH